MTKPRQLTPREVLFVGGETPRIYQHTGGLILLDGRETPGFCFETFRHHMEQRMGKIPHFRWKLHEVPMGLDLPYWVEDRKFSFDNHIRRIAVPSPGNHVALSELVSYLYSRHLDRGRPLWETWFIEGLPEGRFAVMQKMHHCMMDGEGASLLSEATCDFELDAAPRELDPALAEAQPGGVPQLWQQSLNAGVRLAGLPLRAGREVLDALRHDLARRLGRGAGAKQAARPSVPWAVFNGDIGSERGFVFGSLPMEDIKAVKNHFSVTLNDVVLAVVGSSVRDYLLARDKLPDLSLRTSVAVSLRTDSDEKFSNRITTMSVTLATDLADPVQRLRAIAAESDLAKREARGGGKGVLEILQIFPPVLINAMMHLAPPEQMIAMAGVNLIVSSVRGSPQPMYMGGGLMTAMYPMSIITPGAGINVTCISYAGHMNFGITIDPELVPDPWRIIDGLHRSLAYYLALIAQPAARSKPKARRPVSPAGRRRRR